MKFIRKLLFTSIFLFLFCSYQVYAESPPKIVGKAAITIDVSTREMIYTKNIDDRMFPASTTKLMTAIILAENKKPEDIFTYSKNAKIQEPFSINYNIKPIEVNDKISASQAMDAMLVGSANDMAYMIAENAVNGDYKNFIELMNKKAASLHLKNTHFVTPNGLHNPDHYSSAYDLSVIAREAYKYPWIIDTIKKKDGQLNTQNGVIAKFDNKVKILNENGCIGGKTGYTKEAGRCLVAYYEVNNRKLIGVVLKSDYDKDDKTVFNDMQKMVSWSYNAKKETMLKKNTNLKKISLKYHLLPFNLGPEKTVNVSLSTKEDVKKYNNEDVYNVKYSTTSKNPWKFKKNKSIGHLTVTGREAKSEYKLYPSISKGNLIKSNLLFYIGIFIIIFAIIFLVFYFKRKRNRKKKNSTIYL